MSTDDHTPGRPTWMPDGWGEEIPPTPPYSDRPWHTLSEASRQAICVAIGVCHRKRRYYTHSGASQALARVRHRKPDTDDLVVYQCSFCRGYHLGSETKKQQNHEQFRKEK